ncbi:MAG: hypothetical protein H6772_02420 [Pseudomonadales bacterium]|nr:hypothetical protein [Pseudomonadales bacterium]
MDKETKTHTEFGIRSQENKRLINQLQLQKLSPDIDFFPKVVGFKDFDNSQGYEVEQIVGQTFQELMSSTSSSDFIRLLLVATEQQQKLFKNYGILVKDRNKDNFIFGVKDENSNLKVYQVDLESIYDSVTDADFLDINEHLLSRSSNPIKISNENKTGIEIADICDSLQEIFIEYLKRKKRTQIEQQVYVKWNKRLGTIRRIKNFDKLTILFEDLLRIFGN